MSFGWKAGSHLSGSMGWERQGRVIHGAATIEEAFHTWWCHTPVPPSGNDADAQYMHCLVGLHTSADLTHPAFLAVV
jgi:hypothetical protein